jgi:hypothetical protein
MTGGFVSPGGGRFASQSSLCCADQPSTVDARLLIPTGSPAEVLYRAELMRGWRQATPPARRGCSPGALKAIGPAPARWN